MSRANEVFNYERRLEWELRKVDSDTINGKLLRKFYSFSVAEGISIARVVKRLCHLRTLGKILNKEYDHATKDDIVELIAKIERLELSPSTKRDHKLILRKFYQWLRGYGMGKYPPEVAWIPIPNHVESTVRKQDLLTWEEVQRMINLTRNVRDKAFIMVLFDAGLRISEILPLRIEDVELDETGGVLYSDGKTGKAPGIIGWSAPALATWLDNHPFRDDPKAHLWCRLGISHSQMISYDASRSMILKHARKAGIKKRVWHHLFKHTAATRDSKKLPGALMNLKYHWKQHSAMPSFYIHLSGEDIKDVQHLLYGTKPKTQSNELNITLHKCPRCSISLSPESSFCNKCGLSLNSASSLQIRKVRSKADDLLNKLTENPEKLEKLLALIEG